MKNASVSCLGDKREGEWVINYYLGLGWRIGVLLKEEGVDEKSVSRVFDEDPSFVAINLNEKHNNTN